MALKFAHTFSEANGTDLAAATPETDIVGTGWADSAINSIETDGIGGCKFAAINRNSRADVGTADQYVIANWNSGGADNRFSIYLRSDDTAGATTSYQFNIGPGNGTGYIQIAKLVGGVFTLLASDATIPLDVSTTYSLEPRIVGSTLSFYIDGVNELEVTGETSIATGDFVNINHALWTNGNGRLYDIEVYDADPSGSVSLLETTNYQGMNRMNGGMRS